MGWKADALITSSARGHMAWSAAQMFGHLPGLFQQLLRVAYHLRVAAQHRVAGFSRHRQTNRLFQRTILNQAGTRPVSEPSTVSRLAHRLDLNFRRTLLKLRISGR